MTAYSQELTTLVASLADEYGPDAEYVAIQALLDLDAHTIQRQAATIQHQQRHLFRLGDNCIGLVRQLRQTRLALWAAFRLLIETRVRIRALERELKELRERGGA